MTYNELDRYRQLKARIYYIQVELNELAELSAVRLDGMPHSSDGIVVPKDALMLLLHSPAAIPVHNDCHMLRHTAHVYLFSYCHIVYSLQRFERVHPNKVSRFTPIETRMNAYQSFNASSPLLMPGVFTYPDSTSPLRSAIRAAIAPSSTSASSNALSTYVVLTSSR